MPEACPFQTKLDPKTYAFYSDVLGTLDDADVPFLLGGGYALMVHTGIQRQTKDLDIFVRRRHRQAVLDAVSAAGYRAEVVFPHWLAKVFAEHDFVDVIYSSGNGLAEVTDSWFENGIETVVMNRRVRLCAAEEMIWSKAFIQERERFDGADIVHLFRARGAAIDWRRLLTYFGPHWMVLLSHLLLFRYVYPGEPCPVPSDVLSSLLLQWQREANPQTTEAICRGTMLSREQYLADIQDWGYADARLQPRGNLSPEDIRIWTEAIHRS